MNDNIIKTRCKEGHLIIQEKQVLVEALFGMEGKSLPREQITGVELKVTQMDFLGMGQCRLTIYSTGGQTLVAHMVKTKDAKAIQELLQK